MDNSEQVLDAVILTALVWVHFMHLCASAFHLMCMVPMCFPPFCSTAFTALLNLGIILAGQALDE